MAIAKVLQLDMSIPFAKQLQTTTARVLLGMVIGLGLLADYVRVVQPYMESRSMQGLVSSSRVKRPAADVAPVLNQVHLAMGQAQYGQAIDILREGLKSQPRHLDLLLELGMAYRKDKQFAQADQVYQKLTEFYPSCIECVNNRAVNMIQSGDSPQAIGLLKDLTAKNPLYAEAFLNLGIAYEKNGKFIPAISSYQQFLKLIPNNDGRPDPAMARERIRQLQEGL